MTARPEAAGQVSAAELVSSGRYGHAPGLPPSEAPRQKPPRGFCVRISRAVRPESRCYKHLVQSNGKGHHVGGNHNALPGDRSNSADGNNNKHSRQRTELVYVRFETLGNSIANLNTQVVNERVLEGLLHRLTTLDGARTPAGVNVATQIMGAAMSSAGSEENLRALACQVAIEKFLCRLVYPSCHFRRTDVSALVRPPCREDCILLRDSICSNLRWSEFSRALREAFNETLMSSLSALELIADGDSQPTSENFLKDFVSQVSEPSAPNGRAPIEHNVGNQSQTSDGQALSSLHFYWPHEHSIERCESLPPLRKIPVSSAEIRAGQLDHHVPRSELSSLHKYHWPMCSGARLADIIEKNSDALDETKDQNSNGRSVDCSSWRNGSDYAGKINTTHSGRPCQEWTSQSPHKHKMSSLLFDNMREAHNYCRNPGGLEIMPWCYTQDLNVRWEFCDVRIC